MIVGGDMAKLTEKQKRFAEEYLIDLNATQAALRAGYSKKNADKIGSELLGKTRVSEYIQERQKQLQIKTGITQERVLAELEKIGFARITDYLEYETALRVVDYNVNGEPQYDWAMLVNAKNSSEVDGGPIQEVSISKDGTFKFKLYSKLDALEKIGRHLGIFENQGKRPTDDRDDDNLFKAIREAVTNDEV